MPSNSSSNNWTRNESDNFESTQIMMPDGRRFTLMFRWLEAHLFGKYEGRVFCRDYINKTTNEKYVVYYSGNLIRDLKINDEYPTVESIRDEFEELAIKAIDIEVETNNGFDMCPRWPMNGTEVVKTTSRARKSTTKTKSMQGTKHV